MINAGDADIVVAGGMESMTQAPYLLPGARAGYRIGDGKLVDSMMYDGLFCAFDQCAMGLGTERYNGADGDHPRAPGRLRRRSPTSGRPPPSRTASSPTRSSRSSVPQRKGDPLVVDTDEGVRPETTAESLGSCSPAFDKDGTITAGNASQISDGGAAVIVMSKAKADGARASPRSASWSATARSPAPTRRCSTSRPRPPRWPWREAGLTVAGHRPLRDQRGLRRRRAAPPPTTSASATRSSTSTAAPSPSAIPSGMSGTRLALTALLELKRRGGGTAAVSLCGGGGQGDAAVLRTL